MSRSSWSGLKTQCARHCGTITLYQNKGDTKEGIKKLLLQYFNSTDCVLHYYFIYHDDDENNLHFHYIIHYANNGTRLGTTLNKLSTFLGLSTDQIAVEKLTSINAYLRYFLHLDEDNKKKYSVEDICSDENVLVLNNYLNTDDEVITCDYLISVVLMYHNECDICKHVGLAVYHKYRHEIHMFFENKPYLECQYPNLKPSKVVTNDLPF